jgi:hypothetical protein
MGPLGERGVLLSEVVVREEAKDVFCELACGREIGLADRQETTNVLAKIIAHLTVNRPAPS